MVKSAQHPVYSKNTMEFVTVAKSFCDYLDRLDSVDKQNFIEVMVRLLPLIYLKASLLPENEPLSEEALEAFATEDRYTVLMQTIAGILGHDDAYLEVFHADINFSDTPVVAFISENIADIWQDLFNFISVFRLGLDETMNDALFMCRSNFEQFWGQSLVNVLRALHNCKYSRESEDDTEGDND